MLQVTTVFSNFPQLIQPTKIKNTCGYCDLFELEIPDNIKAWFPRWYSVV